MYLMIKGGNDALHDFFDKYDLNSSDIKTKFTSKAAQFYRKRLAAQAVDDQFVLSELELEGEPSREEGRQQIEGLYPSLSKQNSSETHDPQNDPEFTYRSSEMEEEDKEHDVALSPNDQEKTQLNSQLS